MHCMGMSLAQFSWSGIDMLRVPINLNFHALYNIFDMLACVRHSIDDWSNCIGLKAAAWCGSNRQQQPASDRFLPVVASGPEEIAITREDKHDAIVWLQCGPMLMFRWVNMLSNAGER